MYEGLVRRGHDVTVVHSADAFSLRSAAPAIPIEDPPGLHRVSIRSGFGALTPVIVQQTRRPGLLRPALQRVLDAPCDVVHFHNVSLIGGPGVFPMSRAPVILHTPHDHWLFCATHVL
ncbi:MAG: glycosyltransferase [Gemmatimonadota bacterium]|nr:glycosyltransferase [Gemmatimonadota bacterium]MDQ8166139.1 glycosyltransferase [Gemmatimonadota bacterium]MDQ8171163.1 glycosyltransferase [Gemmatimonadota bacterium]